MLFEMIVSFVEELDGGVSNVHRDVMEHVKNVSSNLGEKSFSVR